MALVAPGIRFGDGELEPSLERKALIGVCAEGMGVVKGNLRPQELESWQRKPRRTNPD